MPYWAKIATDPAAVLEAAERQADGEGGEDGDPQAPEAQGGAVGRLARHHRIDVHREDRRERQQDPLEGGEPGAEQPHGDEHLHRRREARGDPGGDDAVDRQRLGERQARRMPVTSTPEKTTPAAMAVPR